MAEAIVFPYDSASIDNLDRAVNSDGLALWQAMRYTDGVAATPLYMDGVKLNQCAVSFVSGMTVQVDTGAVVAANRARFEPNVRELIVQAASAQDRIDNVVARHDNNFEERTLDYYIVKGAPASVPVPPALTRNNVVWEICLAQIFVPAGVSTLSPELITDTRMNPDLCGFISSADGTADTGTMAAQYQALLGEIEEELKRLNAGTEAMLKTMYDPEGGGRQVQFEQDDRLETDAKTVPGGLNELNNKVKKFSDWKSGALPTLSSGVTWTENSLKYAIDSKLLIINGEVRSSTALQAQQTYTVADLKTIPGFVSPPTQVVLDQSANCGVSQRMLITTDGIMRVNMRFGTGSLGQYIEIAANIPLVWLT